MNKKTFKISNSFGRSVMVSNVKITLSETKCLKAANIKTSTIIHLVVLLFFMMFSYPSNAEESIQKYSNQAILSENVYLLGEGGDAPNGYELIDYTDERSSGFTVATYKNTITGEVTVSFGGTTAGESGALDVGNYDLNDIRADIKLVMGWSVNSPQLVRAKEYLLDISNQYSDVSVVGHSLGGALALYAASDTDISVVTFNSAPYPLGTNYNSSTTINAVNIRTSSDPLSGALNVMNNIYNQRLEAEDLDWLVEAFQNIDYEDIRAAIQNDTSLNGVQKNIALGLLETHRVAFSGTKVLVEFLANTAGHATLGLLRSYFGISPTVNFDEMFVGKQIVVDLDTGHSMTGLRQYIAINDYEFPPISDPNIEPVEPPAEDTNTDRTDDEIEGIVEDADPDTPVTPDPVLVGVFSGVNGTPSSNLAIQGTLSNVVETSTGNASFEITGDCVSGCTVTGTTPEPEASSYSHLSWGRLNQTVRMTDSNTGITHDIQNMRWLYGDATSSDYLNTRTGTASYAGQIYADFTEGGVTQYNTITGGIGLSFNFSDDSLSGQAYFSQNGVPQEGFDITGGVISHEGQQHLQATLSSQDPNTSGSITSGGLLGTFYGPEANEVGGAIWAFGTASEHDEAFSVAGVFVARTGETFVMPTIDYGNITPPVTPAFTQVYTGHARGYWPTYSNNSSQQARLKNSELYTTSNAQDALAVGQNELSANQSFHTSGNSGLVIETSAATRGSYSFTDWGTWDNASATVLDRNGAVANRGHWIIGANTHESQIPRSGTATYNGEAVGTDHTGASITGTARLQADFSADTIDAQLDLNKNGSSWASVTFAPMGIVAPSDSSAIGETRVFSGHVGNGDGAITGLPSSSDAFIGGAFYGDQAQEVGGYWDISDTTGDGTFTGAEGVFRATQ